MLQTPSAGVCGSWFARSDRAEQRVLREMLAEHGHALVSLGRRAAAVLAPAGGEHPGGAGSRGSTRSPLVPRPASIGGPGTTGATRAMRSMSRTR
jgi:hypothetical protein